MLTEERGAGLSVELSDTRRRGSAISGRNTSQDEEPASRRRSIAARNAAKAPGAAARGTGERPKPRSSATNTRMCQARPRSGAKPGATHEKQASCAGPRPDGVYAYAERSRGRANRRFVAGRARFPRPWPHLWKAPNSTSPFVFRCAAIFMPQKMGNLQPCGCTLIPENPG